MLQGKKILLGITGSIAAYKAIYLVRLLVREGAEVRVIMTPAARDFVSPLTLSTLSRHPVLSDLSDGQSWANHVMLGRWADVFLVAPLSCNTLAKMAQGLCDNLLLATYLSATSPVVIAPAMDEDMWHHASTQRNLELLVRAGNRLIPVESGELASGLVGEGRMAEPDSILRFLIDQVFSRGELAGRKALVSAGPTYEPIDPVRFIANHSSGKMGIALAEELSRRGADVTLVLGPTPERPADAAIRLVRVETAAQMYDACVASFDQADLAVMAAAVADFTPANPAGEKIKKQEGGLVLELSRTRDILQRLGELKRAGQVLVGFALETTREREHAQEKLQRKNADLIVLNSLRDPGAGFGSDTNKVTLFSRDGRELALPMKSKPEVARDITDFIIQHYYA
ncbi:MAG TPA: bifunctional phosphopantothenoylcysteine decarboxylase/phosphopantothenate--cysteine ligase CoaBC [Chitinophagaceae bacterium]|nr:bifunctional phosphopantothenoylcysteine decarboxylase/phosphopantothenate--cysteine ligase CoaBC [Chitinophagaceae bacterium]